MSAALEQLLGILDLEEIELNTFRGRTPKENRVRVFGGQVAGQALVAAGRTVEDRAVHSLHAYFLRAGDPSIPILYQVDRIRDGKSFATRRVVAVQRGQAIFNLAASFQVHEDGLEHQAAMPEAPDPESLPTFKERVAPMVEKAPPEFKRWLQRERPIDIRYAAAVDYLNPPQRPPNQLVWIRADGTLPDEPLIHQYVAAYASDMTLLDTITMPHGVSSLDQRTYQMASLDHAMWFHRPFRADGWLLYVQESPAAAGSRGFTRGSLFTREGALVASVAQEGLMRKRIGKPRGRV